MFNDKIFCGIILHYINKKFGIKFTHKINKEGIINGENDI